LIAPRVSIVLPTLNGEACLERLLPTLAAQELPREWNGFEICAVDSSSTDRTRALLRQAGADVRTIARADFRHGRTRNLAAGGARGEFLVFLSQDAVPADEHCICHLIAAFDDPRVAGAYSRVLPNPEDDLLTQRTVLDLPEASERAVARDLDGVGSLSALTGEQRASWLRFNNVASAVRAGVFRRMPFPDVPFGEDFAWAALVLAAGHRIRFAPQSVVHHAHRYGPREAFARYRVDAAFHREVHGYRMRPSLLSACKGLAYEVGRDFAFLRASAAGLRASAAGPRLRAACAAPLLRAAQVAGQYAGSRGWGGPAARDFGGLERIG
jgi:rhamnosyltransferase